MNERSSRSHTIFRMVIESRERGIEQDSRVSMSSGTVRVSSLVRNVTYNVYDSIHSHCVSYGKTQQSSSSTFATKWMLRGKSCNVFS
jgi:hypothetical protein